MLPEADHVRAGDIDGDGDNDVIYRSSDNTMSAYLNSDGVGGAWDPGWGDVEVGDEIFPLATGDLDMDGDDDIAFIVDPNYGQDGSAEYALRVFGNGAVGDDSWQDLTEEGFFDPAFTPQPYMIDLDLDGDEDIVVANVETGIFFFENLCIQ